MSIKNLNWDQHRLTENSIHSVKIGREYRDILARAVQGGHPLIAQSTRSGHYTIHIKDDGSVVFAGTGGRGRGTANFESQLRRNLRTVNADFPRKNESMKQFERRIAKKQGTQPGDNNTTNVD